MVSDHCEGRVSAHMAHLEALVMSYRQSLRIAFILLAFTAFLLSQCRASGIEATAQDKPAPKSNLEMNMTPEQWGDLYMIHHQYLEAIDAYRKAPRDSAVVWNKLGIAYHHMFALEEAREDYARALKLDPKYGEALNNLAAVYYAEKDYRRAEKTYRRAIKLIPTSATAYNNLGTAYFADGKLKQGADAYRAAFAIDPAVFKGDPLQAISETSSNEERARVDYCLAELYARAGMKEQAIEYLRKALDAGFSDNKRLLQDQEFASIRQSAEFEQLVAMAKRP
jgi:tetratricopeptide (TPR) repeat protein